MKARRGDPIELHELRAFLAVIKHRRFGKAAEALKVTPSAVSQNVSALEEKLGVVLFEARLGRLERHRTRELTEAGDELHVRALRIVQEVDAVPLAVQPKRFLEGKDSVRLAIASEYREPVIAAVAPMLRKTRKVQVLIDGRKDEPRIMQGVYDGNIELGIVTEFSINPERHAFQRVGDVPLQIVVHKEHPLASTEGIRDIMAFKRERFVFPASPFAARGFFDEVTAFGFLPKMVLETTGPESALTAVRANPLLVTVTAVPQHVDRRDLVFMDFHWKETSMGKLQRVVGGRDLLVGDRKLPLGTYLIWHRLTPRSEATRRVADALCAYFGSGAPAPSSEPASKQ